MSWFKGDKETTDTCIHNTAQKRTTHALTQHYTQTTRNSNRWKQKHNQTTYTTITCKSET